MSAMIEGWVEKKDKRRIIFDEHQKVITSIVKKAHRVALIPQQVTISSHSDIFSGYYFFNTTAFGSTAYIADLTMDEMSFYRTIYKHSKPEPIITHVNDEYFDKYHQLILAVLSNFYEEVHLVWVTSGELGNLSGFLSRIITPEFKIKENYLKFVAKKPRYSQLESMPTFLNLDEVNFRENQDYLTVFFNNYNDRVIPEELGIKLDKDMSMDELKQHLALIAMYML